jgi:hypothetical protein
MRLHPWMVVCLFAVTQAMAQTPNIQDRLFPAQSAKMGGYTGEKLEASYQNRILAQDVNRLIAPFNNRTETSCWQSEFWGKWFTSAVLAYRYRPDPKLKSALDKAVAGLLQTQTPDGYIGNYADASHLQSWDIWGRKYCMLGLIAYYDITGDTKSMEAAKKVADHLMKELQVKDLKIVKLGNHRGMAASSVLEPITLLYNRTKDLRYLNFAKEIVKEWETPDGPQLLSKSGIDVAKRFPKPKSWFGWEQGQKAYEMMSCYEGLLELYRITGNASYKEAVEQTWNNINEKEINIAGSGSAIECWFGGKQLQTMPIAHYQETCVTATWIKLNQQLLRLTGEAKYADAIEQTYYNALLASMKRDGSDWAKYSPLAGIRLEGDQQCSMGLNCCVASGPRGLFTLPLTAVMSEKEGLRVNFFAEGNYLLQTPAQQTATIIQQTDYPVTGNIGLQISIPNNETFTMSLRIPAWSQRSVVSVNGEAVTGIVAGKYVTIKREWKPGDRIIVSLDMRGRLVHLGEFPENIAIVRGPIVLARDVRLSGPGVDEAAMPVVNKEGFIDLEPTGNQTNGIWMQFKAPFLLESHKEAPAAPVPLVLCDYASAGNTFDEQSHFRVWLPQLYDVAKHK